MAPKAAATPGRRKASDTFKEATSFSSFSVNDLKQARDFYAEVLGLDVTEKPEGLELETSDATIFLISQTKPYSGFIHGSKFSGG